MRIKLELPQEIAEALETEARDLSRTALEGLVLEGYRSGKQSESQIRRLLDFRTRHEVDACLKEHGVPTPCTEQDLEQDIGDAQKISRKWLPIADTSALNFAGCAASVALR